MGCQLKQLIFPSFLFLLNNGFLGY